MTIDIVEFFQAFLEHGIQESPHVVVALMQQVWPLESFHEQ